MNYTNQFCQALKENNKSMLLQIPKSDLHNHSSKGCKRDWLEEHLNRKLQTSPESFDGIEGMHEWFTNSIKPYCKGLKGSL